MEGAAGWLARLLEATAADVVEPAVIDAAEAAILQPAVAQVRSAMRAVQADQARPSLIVPEQNQVLAQDANGKGRAVFWQLFGDGNWLPVTPKQLTTRGSGSGPRE